MCGRKTLTRDMQSIIEELAIEEWEDDSYLPSYNIAPTQVTPILLHQEDSRVVKPMKWGLIPSWSKDESIGSKMINARVETLTEKPSFQNLVHQHRCVVIADGYYEWKRTQDGNQPYYISHPDNKLLPMAGLWTTWTNQSGGNLHSYTVITTTPQSAISHIHNRMPVILNPMAIDDWIQCETVSPNQALQTLMPYAKALSYHPVSTLMNSPNQNSKECIRSVQDASTLNLF